MNPNATAEETLRFADQIIKTFKAFDADGNGEITRAEFMELLCKLDQETWTTENCEEFLRHLDQNGNGAIEYTEFINGLFNQKIKSVEKSILVSDDVLRIAVEIAEEEERKRDEERKREAERKLAEIEAARLARAKRLDEQVRARPARRFAAAVREAKENDSELNLDEVLLFMESLERLSTAGSPHYAQEFFSQVIPGKVEQVCQAASLRLMKAALFGERPGLEERCVLAAKIFCDNADVYINGLDLSNVEASSVRSLAYLPLVGDILASDPRRFGPLLCPAKTLDEALRILSKFGMTTEDVAVSIERSITASPNPVVQDSTRFGARLFPARCFNDATFPAPSEYESRLVCTVGGVPYYEPDGWIQVYIEPDAMGRGFADGRHADWPVAYHGTSIQNLRPILDTGLRNPGAIFRTLSGKDSAVKSVRGTAGAKSGERPLYVSPSLWTSAHPLYARLESTEPGRWAQMVLKLRIKPGSYRAQANTLIDEIWSRKVLLDPNLSSNAGIEWIIADPEAICIVAVLVRELGEGVNEEYFGTLCAQLRDLDGPKKGPGYTHCGGPGRDWYNLLGAKMKEAGY